MPTSHAASFSSAYNDIPSNSATPTHDAPRSGPAASSPHSFLSSFLLLNARSLNPSANSASRWKLHDLIGHVEEGREAGQVFPFIAITETWLKSYFSDAQLQIPGYSLSRCDRSKRHGGGVLLYSLSSLTASASEIFDDGTCQGLCNIYPSSKLLVAVVYRPPDASHSSFSQLLDHLKCAIDNLADSDYDIFITGDFNFPQIEWESLRILSGGTSESNLSAQCLLNFMSNFLLNQMVTVPTRGQNTLDLVLCNNDRLISDVKAVPTDISDHDMVSVLLSFNPAHIEDAQSTYLDQMNFRALDFNQADFTKLNEIFDAVNWEKLRHSCSFEEFPAKFTQTVLNVCLDNVPQKRPPSGKPKVYNALRRKKSKLKVRLSAAKCTGDPVRIKELEDAIGLVSYEIKEAVVHHLDQSEKRVVERIRTNPKYFFSYAKSFSKVKNNISTLLNSNQELATDRKELANILQQQFCSVFSDPNSSSKSIPTFKVPPLIRSDTEVVLTPESIVEAISEIKLDSAPGPDGIPAILLKRCATSLSVPIHLLWSESQSSGIVPSFYKTGFITPLFKKGSRCEASNYRPVTLTSHVVKVYERVVRKHMVHFLETNNLLTDKQHGFRSNRSCLTQMLDHFDDIFEGFTRGEDTDSIYLDYAKAFDKVDLDLLILKLKRYGFGDKLVDWIQSFLSDREQVVVLNGVRSDIAKVLSGVPQGTVLGPLLFILFINDLEQVVNSSTVSFFADDTRISKQISCYEDCMLLQDDLYKILDWSRSNNMKLHEQKFELLNHLHNGKSSLSELPFAVESLQYKVSSQEILCPVEDVRDLGVQVSNDLSWSGHIVSMVTKARSTLSWVFSVFKTRDRTVMTTLYKSLVRSTLEYCCPLWNPGKVTDIQLIEGVQRTFTSRISGLQHLNYWERLAHLKLMSLQRRRERYVILMMWKILHNIVPNCCGIEFKMTSRNGTLAVIPPLAKSSSSSNQTLYDQSFAVQGPKLWNKVPNTVKAAQSFDAFKISLSTFLALIPDNPPVSGYSCSWSNSLVDYSPTRWSDI